MCDFAQGGGITILKNGHAQNAKPKICFSTPDRQLDTLRRAYQPARPEKRRQLLLGGVILLALILIASLAAEVRSATFFVRFGGFFSCIHRIFHLENGALVFSDSVEWLWGFRKWGRLIWETVLISYIGTLTGADG